MSKPSGKPDTLTEALTPERLHARYAKKIDRQIRAFLGSDDDCEDLVQEVLITVFCKVGTLRNPQCLDRWVSQVTRNTLRYAIRQRRTRRHASWEELPDPKVPLFRTDFDARELAWRVLRIMSRMPPNDCALLTRSWLSRTTVGEIAAEKRCSSITVRRRLLKARARFEKLARLDPALKELLDEARARRPRYPVEGARDFWIDPWREVEGASSAA